MGRRKRYSAEFKREALRRANEPGVTDLLWPPRARLEDLARDTISRFRHLRSAAHLFYIQKRSSQAI